MENADNFGDVSNIKKLQAESDYYRIRVSDYRIAITISDDMIIFVRVLQRKEIYRYFP
ncbi:type II toxin-antitoxin system RelE family toxin [Anabaena azotica]|uniref:type II toxin-antitoxin system RelE family toxin n=1 Tax=Anabaena azotica TaxID=197653 RepID=UPI0028C454A4|nr:type II toxin-antitoxin system RelE/ParE family toxin [Anabaena azotica]